MANQALAARETTDIATRPATEYDRLRFQLEKRADEFRMALPSHITPEKLQRTILTAVQSNPELLKADRASLITACMKAAQDALLPDGREAALIVYKTRKKIDGEWMSVAEVQYQSMVYGVRKKIRQSREIKDINAFVVYRAEVEEGLFHYEEGTDRTLRHKPKLDLTEEQATDENIVAAYSMAIYNDGSPSYRVLRRFEIDKRRQMSKTGAIGRIDHRTKQPIQPNGPWVDWYPEQAMKTVLRNHAKMLPSSGDILPDVEEMAEDLASRSTSNLLGSVEADAPQRLAPPTRDEVAAGDPPHDPMTGEIEPEETEEEIARRLDAETEASREGRTDEQHGDQHDGTGANEEPLPPYQALVDDVTERATNATILGDVIGAENDFAKHRENLPETVVKTVDAAIAAGKAKFAKAAGK